MAKAYRPVVRDQEFLLPPNVADWLPDDHLVWFVLDTVAELDTSALEARAARRRDGSARRSDAGRAGYDPDMLAGLLLYAYCRGQRSSREIERLCHTDVAFRVACAGDVPDHTVLARFRQAHTEAFAGLFTQVLRLCRDAGMVRLGTVAIDGSKITANASRDANRGEDWLREQAEQLDRTAGERAGEREVVTRILDEAAALDAAEDAAVGAQNADHGGDGSDTRPPGWGGRAGRRERIRAARRRIEAADAAGPGPRRRAGDEQRITRDTAALAAAEAALAEQLTAHQAKIDTWERAWEHAIATRGPVPRGRAPRPVEDAHLVVRARERLATARRRLDQPDTTPRRGRRADPDQRGRRDRDQPARTNITDPDSSLMPTRNGWIQGYNAHLAVSADQIIIAAHLGTNPADITYYDHMVTATTTAVNTLDATDELGTLLLDAGYASNHTLTAPGPDRLIALGKTHSVLTAARENPAEGPPPESATAREAMDHRLRTPHGAALYTR